MGFIRAFVKVLSNVRYLLPAAVGFTLIFLPKPRPSANPSFDTSPH